ncbi:hypothetical protein KBI33_00885 [Candidatus Shapirobacteria bacterium]|nr:hypothetical protein [Candidatus Shapirobacteria bacterium]
MFCAFSILTLLSYLALFFLSYCWVDPNLTLTSWEPLNQILEQFKHFGYTNPSLSSRLYLLIITILFLEQIYLLFSHLLSKAERKKLLLLAAAVIFLAALSYPFLSHDLFSYLFDAKIIWHYQKNPYLFSPNQFASDPWLRFTHWTHRTTPYGPVWLAYSLLPAIFSFGHFALNFYGLKLLNGLVFFAAGWCLLKINQDDRRVFAYWFFNPFLLIELVVNSHNDLLMIALFFASLFFYHERKKLAAAGVFLLSVATKFITILSWPLVFFKNRHFWATGFLFFLLLGFSWQITRFQPWYFSWAFLALPLLGLTNFSWATVFAGQFLLLVLKYYPFLATGSWEKTAHFQFFQAFFIFLAFFFLAQLPALQKFISKRFRSRPN